MVSISNNEIRALFFLYIVCTDSFQISVCQEGKDDRDNINDDDAQEQDEGKLEGSRSCFFFIIFFFLPCHCHAHLSAEGGVEVMTVINSACITSKV